MLVYRWVYRPTVYILATELQPLVSDLNARRRLRYVSAGCSTHLRARCYHWRPCLPTTVASVWHSLPESARALPSLTVFCSWVKTAFCFVFQLSRTTLL